MSLPRPARSVAFPVAAALLLAPALFAEPLSPEQQRAILEKTETIRLAPSLDALSPGEREALAHLLAVGEIFQRLYEEANHPQAAQLRARLAGQGGELADLFRIFQGPIATTLDNQRLPILAEIAAETPSRNLYPPGTTAAEVEAFLAKHPERRGEILGERTVVRLATAENLKRDRAALARHPVVSALQPGLEARLAELEKAAAGRPAGASPELYAVPYSVAWADEMVVAQQRLFAAAAALEKDDPEFAGYLRNRGRDLLSNDYESGDAAWVTGRFGRLNAQIGSYETYDDALFGVKAFHAVSLLLRDEAATAELVRGLGGLQEIEDALPYEPKKRVRGDLPVGVYEVIADFGQARGLNTATILPNDVLFTRRYGRTILLRRNIMLHPEVAANAARRFAAAVVPELADLPVAEGGFWRTLWHEIGHYLGPGRTRDGRALDQALQTRADSVEEMKSDLVSLFAHQRLFEAGKIDAARLAAVQASGILRTLQNVKPRRDQAYQVMQLAQFNYFLERGLLRFGADERLELEVARYPEVVKSLLAEVLELQSAGDAAAAEAFFTRWNEWTEKHEKLAERLRAAGGARFRLVRYGALGE
jgi:hypothetical protein